MPIDWSACLLRESDGSHTDDTSNRADGRLVRQLSQTWQVIATDSVTGEPWRGASLDEMLAITEPKNLAGFNLIPQPGKTAYFDPSTGEVYPFFICRGASATRDPGAPHRFVVTCQFEDPSGVDGPYAVYGSPSNFEDQPAVFIPTSVQTQVTAWTQSDGKQCTLPTGSLYSDPPVRTINGFNYRATQIETGFNDTKLNDRLYACNDAEVTIDGIAYKEWELMIVDINYDDVEIPIGNHAHPTLAQDYSPAAIVEYTIEAKKWTIKHLPDEVVDPLPDAHPGHRTIRVRADTRFLVGDKTQWANAFEGWGMEQLYLKTTGEPHEVANQHGVPPMDFLGVQPKIDFASFLRTGP